jgi:hypothetical protein
MITIERHWKRLRRPENGDDGFEACVAITVPGRRLRLGAFYGEAPGSHMAGKHVAAWRTRMGSFRGINIRFGWWPRPCVTLLAHTRPERFYDRQDPRLVWAEAVTEEA